MRHVEIGGTGIALPANVLSSADIDEQYGYPAGHTERISGVVSRYVSIDESASDLAVRAIESALENAQMNLNDIDCIIGASGTMEQSIPYNAAKVHAKLNLAKPIPAFDVNMTCLSALMAMDVASTMIGSDQYKNILIFSSEIASVGADLSNIEVGGLFGDGAAAMILTKSNSGTKGIRVVHFETYSEGVEFCQIKGGGSLHHPTNTEGEYKRFGMFEMKGKEVYKLVTKVIDQFMEVVLKRSGLTMDDIDWVVPHQASKLSVLHIQKKLKLDPDKVINIIETRGNQVAASIPSALHELLSSKRVKSGDKILLLGTSAGLSIGAMILEV